MYLHEEYIKRHNLKVPVVIYANRSSAFLKSKNWPATWRILAFYWREPDRHPGFYEIICREVIHDGHEKGSLTECAIRTINCYWDGYEEAVQNMVRINQHDDFEAIKCEEHLLACWQIFLMMHDSWLARNMDEAFFKLVGDSLDPRLSLETRLARSEEARSQLSIHKSIYDVWTYQLRPLVHNESEWLVRLIND